MTEQSIIGTSTPDMKRRVAERIRIGEILTGKQVLDEERFRYLEIDNKQIYRINLIANVIDKYIQEGEKTFGSLTMDDASGQIRVKAFGEDVKQFEAFSQGDTLMVIGLLRSWNNELYILPEIMKKKVPQYLLVRKLELENAKPKQLAPEAVRELKDKIIEIIKRDDEKGGADIEEMILELKSNPDSVNKEIQNMLEDGIAYEPRPGKIRYLG